MRSLGFPLGFFSLVGCGFYPFTHPYCFDMDILEKALEDTIAKEEGHFIKRDTVELLRRQYPAGTRVELVHMDDPQAPLIGTCETVIGVDDVGSIMVNWDGGGRLNVAYGEDLSRKIDE